MSFVISTSVSQSALFFKTIKHYPLSSPQRDIWFDQILHPNVPLYNIGGYARIDGPIDQARFEKALNQVIQENDALRIILHEGESLPTQTFPKRKMLTSWHSNG